MNKKQENSQNPSLKISSQLCSILSSGSVPELEAFLSKHETLGSEVLVKGIFAWVKNHKITHSQNEPLQILFRFFDF